jgi:hypothetical protein
MEEQVNTVRRIGMNIEHHGESVLPLPEGPQRIQ